jgi:hypothetical protein
VAQPLAHPGTPEYLTADESYRLVALPSVSVHLGTHVPAVAISARHRTLGTVRERVGMDLEKRANDWPKAS